MQRVLIIAYYWPPSAGSGVQRWLKFTKYLPQFNWQPVVFTPENPDFEILDEGLIREIPEEVEVVKIPIWEPYFIQRAFSKTKNKNTSAGIVSSKKSGGFFSYLSNWIRGNVFIPDPKVYWRKPAIKFLLKYLEKNPVDLIISSGTPHSMHLIALDLKKQLGLPWIADFRDPWTELDMLDNYHITARNFKKYQALEKQVLLKADLVLTTSQIWKKDFERLGAKKAVCITNGYDESDFTTATEPYEEFVISHFGLFNHLRNPENLWLALEEICEEDKKFADDLKLHFGGSLDEENLAVIRSKKLLSKALVTLDYLSHEEVLNEYKKSALLLLLLFNSESGVGNIPGKVFEYLASEKPILAFGPGDGDAKQILSESGHQHYFYYKTEVEDIKNAIRQIYQEWQQPLKKSNFTSRQFSRKSLTNDLVGEMEKLI